VSEAAISVRGLRKAYGGQEAVRGIDFEVGIGEVFGFLGPNGAGKTTTIEILEGYRERSGGEVTVLGTDPAEPTRAWRERVGLVLQECELDPLMDGQGPRLSRADVESLLRALIDEKLLARSSHGIRFRQPGVLEYLIAAEGVRKMSESGKVGSLEHLTSKVAEASPTSSAAVRSSVEEIVRTRHSDSQQMTTEHYATSAVYTGSRLSTLRFQLSAGGRTSPLDLDSIYGSLRSLPPADAWDAFFVVVAVANQQPASRIINTFIVAWDANNRRVDRWKLLYKVRERELLYRNEVVTRILQSDQPRDWETFLGSLAQELDPQPIMANVSHAADRPIHELIGRGSEWRQVRGLLDLLLEGGSYISGRVW
jgi:hypothetical protein